MFQVSSCYFSLKLTCIIQSLISQSNLTSRVNSLNKFSIFDNIKWLSHTKDLQVLRADEWDVNIAPGINFNTILCFFGMPQHVPGEHKKVKLTYRTHPHHCVLVLNETVWIIQPTIGPEEGKGLQPSLTIHRSCITSNSHVQIYCLHTNTTRPLPDEMPRLWIYKEGDESFWDSDLLGTLQRSNTSTNLCNIHYNM